MVRCPNCGQKTTGDYCQWCKYPIPKGRPTRHRRPIRRRKIQKQAEKETELAAKEQANKEAEEARKAREAQKQAEKEAELAAKEEVKRKAEEERKTTEAQKQAEERAKRGAEEVVGAKLYEGTVKLKIVAPVDLGQMRQLQEHLCQVQDLDLVLVGGSVDEGTVIVVSVVRPIPLIDILREMPPIEQVVKEDEEIQIMLKAE